MFHAIKHGTAKMCKSCVTFVLCIYLQLAVEHDMGPKESAVEFCTYMTEVLYMNGTSLLLFPIWYKKGFGTEK